MVASINVQAEVVYASCDGCDSYCTFNCSTCVDGCGYACSSNCDSNCVGCIGSCSGCGDSCSLDCTGGCSGVALVVAMVAVIAVHTTAQERVKQIVKMTAPAPVQDLVSGRALIIAKIHVQDIAKVVVQLDVLRVMGVSLAVVVTVHAKLAVTLPVMQVPTHKFKSSLAFLLR